MKTVDTKEQVTVTDPVCGMTIDPAGAAAVEEHMGATHHFCSKVCLETFRQDPHKYVTRAGDGHTVHGSHGEKPDSSIRRPRPPKLPARGRKHS